MERGSEWSATDYVRAADPVKKVVPVANEWMKAMDEAGGTVITTLDWHPPEHCSFCRFGPKLEKRLDCVWGCNGTQGICVTGAGVPTAVFDSSSRCTDTVSDVDFQQSRYFQWPQHCIMDTFGRGGVYRTFTPPHVIDAPQLTRVCFVVHRRRRLPACGQRVFFLFFFFSV